MTSYKSIMHSLSMKNKSLTDLVTLLKSSILLEQSNYFDEPHEESYFEEHISKVETNLSNAISLLTVMRTDEAVPKEIVIIAILVAGENSTIDKWTNSKILIQAENVLDLVLNRYGNSDLKGLLSLEFDLIFAELQPKLTKNLWKNYPAAVNCFLWILFQLQCPNLGMHLQSILPACLLLTDDHVNANKIKGLRCLAYLANNVSRTDLIQYGHGAVIYTAIKHMIYLKEPEIIPHLTYCLVALLSKTEHGSNSQSLSWNHFDDVMSIWLLIMEMEQNLVLREVYMDSMSRLLKAMGLGSARWSRKLLSIFSEYCEQEHTRVKSLKNLLTFITTAWPRISNHFNSIVLILVKVVLSSINTNRPVLLQTLCDNIQDSYDESLNLAIQCFKALDKLSNFAFFDFMNKIKENDELVYVYELVTKYKVDSNIKKPIVIKDLSDDFFNDDSI